MNCFLRCYYNNNRRFIDYVMSWMCYVMQTSATVCFYFLFLFILKNSFHFQHKLRFHTTNQMNNITFNCGLLYQLCMTIYVLKICIISRKEENGNFHIKGEILFLKTVMFVTRDKGEGYNHRSREKIFTRGMY